MSEGASASPEPAAAVTPVRSSGRSSALIGAGIFLSRLLGLARTSLMARYLGVGAEAAAFNGAFRITNILQNLLGEGVLSASFIPVYASALQGGDQKEADRIASAVASIVALVSAAIVCAGVLFAPAITRLLVGGFDGPTLDLAIRLTRILFPGAGLFVLSAWCLGILNSHRRFFLSYAAPALWNVAMIVALVAFAPRAGLVDLVVILAWASVAGAALQMGVQLPAVWRLVQHLRPRLDLTFGPVREVIRNFVPAVVSRGVVILSGSIDLRLASSIADLAAVPLLQNAQMIYLLPISLFGMSVSAAELPEMSRQGGTTPEALARVRARLDGGLARVSYFVVPSAVGFMLLGEAIAGLILEYGRFERGDTLRTWAILAASAVGLLASALGRLYSSTFYALRDTRTPFKFAVLRLVVGVALGYLLAFPVPRWLGLAPWTGAVGLALAGAISAWFEFVLLRGAIITRIGTTSSRWALLLKLWGAAGAAGVAGYLVLRLVDPANQTIRAVSALLVFSVVYGAITLALGVPEARALVARVRRR